eukprot:5692383-Karenia_brevis.AAC.1
MGHNEPAEDTVSVPLSTELLELSERPLRKVDELHMNILLDLQYLFDQKVGDVLDISDIRRVLNHD